MELNCANAQAGLRLRCSHTPVDRFSRVEAHILTLLIVFHCLIQAPLCERKLNLAAKK